MSSSFSRAAKRASSSESGILGKVRGLVCGFEVGLFLFFLVGLRWFVPFGVCFSALFPKVKVWIGIFRGVCG